MSDLLGPTILTEINTGYTPVLYWDYIGCIFMQFSVCFHAVLPEPVLTTAAS